MLNENNELVESLGETNQEFIIPENLSREELITKELNQIEPERNGLQVENLKLESQILKKQGELNDALRECSDSAGIILQRDEEIGNLRNQITTLQRTINENERKGLERTFQFENKITYPENENQVERRKTEEKCTQTEQNFPDRTQIISLMVGQEKKIKRNEARKIYLNETSLEGELDLEDFTGLQEIHISPQVNETKLTFKNQGENIKIIRNKKAGITHQEAAEWIKLGFEPKYFWNVSYQPSSNLDLEQLRIEFTTPQNYLSCFYPQKIGTKKMIYLNIRGKNLTGELDLSDFPNLETLDCRSRLEKELETLALNNPDKSKVLKEAYSKCGTCEECQEPNTKKNEHKNKKIVLKFLNNSQKITLELLREVTNTSLVKGGVVFCHGITQDPVTKNLVMVMDYMNSGEIFGVPAYLAPEVLQGKPHTKASDVYSLGIIIYELLANAYPYPDLNDLDLILKVCQGYRPNIDGLKVPNLLKNLIKKCLDPKPEKRPTAK
ncbi:8618_t:CDS:2, partial [Racocetra fulgida]